MIIEADSERKFSRIDFDHHVDLEFISDRYDRCQVENLSLAGMFVKGDFKQYDGRSCHIDFAQPGGSDESCLQALGKVVRKDDRGIGVEFFSMTFESYIFLQTSLINEVDDSILLKDLLLECCPFEVTDEPPFSPIENN